jgi:anti-anti-sigma factor
LKRIVSASDKHAAIEGDAVFLAISGSSGLIDTSSNTKEFMSNRYQISEEQTVRVLRLNLPDVMDTVEVDGLIDNILDEVAKSAGGPWVVDLSNATYMGSSMLGLFVNIRERIKQAGGRLVLSGMPPPLMKIFQTCCLEKLFTIVKSKPDAISLVKKA